MAAKYHNILIVGGVTLPDPSEMVISDYDISESERNANGKMVCTQAGSVHGDKAGNKEKVWPEREFLHTGSECGRKFGNVCR